MKNYKLLVPAALAALFVLGIYMTGSSNAEHERQYYHYLEEARKYAAQEIEVYAGENYQKALEMRPSLGLYLEIADFYQNTVGDRNKAIEWGQAALNAYPKEAAAYEYLLESCLEQQDYMGFYQLYYDMANRHVESEKANGFYQTVEYTYYLQGEYDEASVFSGNMAPVRRNETWGYSNSKGKKKIGTMYAYAGAFNQGMAPVIDSQGRGFFVDTDGNKVFVADTEETVTELGVMSSSGIYAVNNGKEWNYYNQSGELVAGGFQEASTMANGLAACKTDGGWQIYDTSGQVHIDGYYDDVLADEKHMVYRNERLFVKAGDSYRMIDAFGNQIGMDTFEDGKIFYESTYAAVKKDGKWGFIDKDGNWFIAPTYEDARSFSNGYAAVRMNGQWGFINMDQELCIPCQFTDAKDFTANGTVFVQKNLIWSVLLLYQKNY
ncbi:MAG: hypothetical protein HFH82_13615 [Lachnospiraceae bacterium]|nr:hypothetical protein [Lachnospiraceae bacterium]